MNTIRVELGLQTFWIADADADIDKVADTFAALIKRGSVIVFPIRQTEEASTERVIVIDFGAVARAHVYSSQQAPMGDMHRVAMGSWREF